MLPPVPRPENRRGLHILSGGEPIDSDLHWKAQRTRKDFRLCTLVVALGVVAFLCASLAPGLTGLAALMDPTYVFFVGRAVPYLMIFIAFVVPLLLALLGVSVLRHAPAEYLNEHTMAAAAAVFAALLGIILIVLASAGTRPLHEAAVDMSPKCTGFNDKVATLWDHSKTLHKMRSMSMCKPVRLESIENCTGFRANKYTMYLRYLETEFQCGHFCPMEPDHTTPPQSSGRRGRRRGRSALLSDEEEVTHRDLDRQVAHKTGGAGGSMLSRTIGAREGGAGSSFSSASDLDIYHGERALPLHIGDAVVVDDSAKRVAREFKKDKRLTWNADAMDATLGRQLRVISLPGDAVGVHSLDGSQGGVWYYPTDVVRMAVLPGFPYIPSADVVWPLFSSDTFGPPRQACAPLVAARLEATVSWLRGSLLGAGMLLVLASAVVGTAPFVAGACCKN